MLSWIFSVHYVDIDISLKFRNYPFFFRYKRTMRYDLRIKAVEM